MRLSGKSPFILFTFIITFLLSALGAHAAAPAAKRVALVIGNSNYQTAVPLPNPSKDSAAVADMLRGLGFKVLAGTDLDRGSMSALLREFANEAATADAALFYYAGHGIQVGDQNYLLPVDADLQSEMDAELMAMKAEFVLRRAMAAAKVKIMLLDACRENPFANQIASSPTAQRTRSGAPQSGLASMSSGEGTLIAFATGPGQVALDGDGAHSPFTEALLQNLARPGVEIQHALTNARAHVKDRTNAQQRPWQSTNMTGLFYMNPAAAPATADSGKMQVAAASAAAGAATASAIARTAPTRPQPRAGFDPRQIEMEMWRSASASGTAADYQAYLNSYPSGIFAGLARNRLQPPTTTGALRPTPAPIATAPAQQQRLAHAAPGPTAPTQTVRGIDPGQVHSAESSRATEDSLGLNRSKWSEVQKRLTRLGFGTRGTRGSVGAGTRGAIRKWQTRRGYPASSYLNRLQYQALFLEKLPARPVAKKRKRIKRAAVKNRRKARQTRQRRTKSYNGPNLGHAIGAAIVICKAAGKC